MATKQEVEVGLRKVLLRSDGGSADAVPALSCGPLAAVRSVGVDNHPPPPPAGVCAAEML